MQLNLKETSFLELAQAFHGVNPFEMKPVLITTMTQTEQRKAQGNVKIKACYDNCFNLSHSFNATYVLGISNSHGFPVAHAWLKIGDIYIDPTIQLTGQQFPIEYYSLLEIPVENLITLIGEIAFHSGDVERAPMLETLSNHPSYKHLFSSRSRNRLGIFQGNKEKSLSLVM